jgi:hypothetical protein
LAQFELIRLSTTQLEVGRGA